MKAGAASAGARVARVPTAHGDQALFYPGSAPRDLRSPVVAGAPELREPGSLRDGLCRCTLDVVLSSPSVAVPRR